VSKEEHAITAVRDYGDIILSLFEQVGISRDFVSGPALVFALNFDALSLNLTVYLYI
jgi:hypothetical protein